jgi:hypothetical protein
MHRAGIRRPDAFDAQFGACDACLQAELGWAMT